MILFCSDYSSGVNANDTVIAASGQIEDCVMANVDMVAAYACMY